MGVPLYGSNHSVTIRHDLGHFVVTKRSSWGYIRWKSSKDARKYTNGWFWHTALQCSRKGVFAYHILGNFTACSTGRWSLLLDFDFVSYSIHLNLSCSTSRSKPFLTTMQIYQILTSQIRIYLYQILRVSLRDCVSEGLIISHQLNHDQSASRFASRESQKCVS